MNEPMSPSPDALWSSATRPPPLAAGEVHVWRVDAASDPERTRARLERLATEEVARAQRFHRDVDRDRWVAAHAALRRLLAAYSGRDEAELGYVRGPHGKPALAPPTRAGLEFNISHSGDWALCAFALGRPVGVDVEKEKDWRDLDAIACRYFSAEEVDALRQLDDAVERRRAFYRCWSRKEAWIKATGRGIGAPLGGFTVSIEPGRAGLLGVADAPAEAERWWMEELSVASGYAAAVVTEVPGPRLVRLHLEDE